MNYRVVGSRNVAGVEPGSILNSDDLHGCNLGALVEGGHLQPIPPRAVKAATSAQADEAATHSEEN